MLLRRFITHFNRQDWFAVIVDFFIVVLGIFVGLQVDQWNQGRKERNLEAQYIVSIKEDLAADIAELDRTIELARDRAHSGRGLINSLNQKTVIGDANDFIWAVIISDLLNYPSYTRNTVEELSSTGNLRLLRNDSLKSSLAAYYATIYGHEQFTPNWREMQIALEHTLPDILDFSMREAGHLRYMGGPEWIDRKFNFSNEDAEIVLQRIIDHPLAKGQIENMVRIQDSHYVNLLRIREQAAQIEESL